MPLAVLDAGERLRVLIHAHLRPVEHGGLVHVVPRIQAGRRALVHVVRKARGPPVTHELRGEVEVGGGARPAPAVELRAVRLLDEELLVVRLLVDRISHILLDMRIDDRHHLPAGGREEVLHLLGLGELVLVPREVPLAVRVLDVQPQHVVRQVELLEFAVHELDVFLVVVVPPALVVAQREARRERRRACEPGILRKDLLWCGPWQQEDVDHARLRHPVCCRRRRRAAAGERREEATRRLGPRYVHERLARVEPERADGGVGSVCEQQRHTAVQRHR
mmetsp:Transcript_28532/g.73202  ORF Transcript_28532/g.73202 Transcript_28532/m.73202 type:complete len:278 (-) Transcript_28532:1000-1833(-)